MQKPITAVNVAYTRTHVTKLSEKLAKNCALFLQGDDDAPVRNLLIVPQKNWMKFGLNFMCVCGLNTDRFLLYYLPYIYTVSVCKRVFAQIQEMNPHLQVSI